MNVCTIARRGSLARARVMAATLREHHPEASLSVLLLDAAVDEVEPLPDARMLGAEDLAGEDFGAMAAVNDPAALPIATLPYLMRDAIRSTEARALYIGAGQRLLGRLDELLAMLDEFEIVLVARAGSEPMAARQFTGTFDGSIFSQKLFGLRAGASTERLLAAWPRYFRVGSDGRADAVRAWFDRIPALTENVGVLRDPGYGLDRWTLATRQLAPVTAAPLDGAVHVGGRPARAVDFSELRPDDPDSWFESQDRTMLSEVRGLESLVAQHARELQQLGFEAECGVAFLELSDGLRLTPVIRNLIAEALADENTALTQSPFTDTGRCQLYDYLNQPVERGSAVGLTRLHLAIWDAREDLRAAYPHIDGPDGEGFAGWLCVHGEDQEGLVPELLPPTPKVAYRESDPNRHEEGPRWGANVVGFFTAELGVGEAARMLMAGLDARRIPALPIQGRLIPPSRQETKFPYVRPDEAAFPVNIICINGDGIPVFAREAGRSFFEGRYTIAMWWWEVGPPPDSWSRAYEFIDEVWVGSRHILDAISPSSPVPVLQIGLPVSAPQVVDRTRSQLGLPADGFLFLYLHDYHSVAGRKNPIGAIEAFRRAFPAGGEAKLVVKSMNAPNRPREHDRVVRAARGQPDITLIDGYVSNVEKNTMIARCDCYVSLHRSEGLGLTVAEAMLLEKPVIATGYGGTREFMTDQNSYVVGYELVPVGEGHGPYPSDGVWAEPDVDEAAAAMRLVFENPQQAGERAARARQQMIARHSPAVAGAAIERRLALINERLYRDGVRNPNLARLPSLRGTQPSQLEPPNAPTIDWGGGRRGRLKWRANRPVANWVQAYIQHRREVDAETHDMIERVDERIDRLDERLREVARILHEQQNARHAETMALLRSIESELRGLSPGRPGEISSDAWKPTHDPGSARSALADRRAR